jgi:hypothetical protein
VDADVRPPRGPHADARPRADVRGCDGCVRKELAAINAQIVAGYALALRLRYGYEQSLWNISARDLTLTTPRIAS